MILKVGLKLAKGFAINTKATRESLQKNLVIYRVKSCRQVKEKQTNIGLIVNHRNNVIMNFSTSAVSVPWKANCRLLDHCPLKAQYWPLCFACLCCCFGFQGSEAAIVIKEFYSGHKQKPQNFQHHKNGYQEIAACNAQWAIPRP